MKVKRIIAALMAVTTMAVMATVNASASGPQHYGSEYNVKYPGKMEQRIEDDYKPRVLKAQTITCNISGVYRLYDCQTRACLTLYGTNIRYDYRKKTSGTNLITSSFTYIVPWIYKEMYIWNSSTLYNGTVPQSGVCRTYSQNFHFNCR